MTFHISFLLLILWVLTIIVVSLFAGFDTFFSHFCRRDLTGVDAHCACGESGGSIWSPDSADRWWGCRVYYCVLYLASSILHISMICLTLIVCCMCSSPCWCSLCDTNSDNRHSGFLHDHLELLYHRQNRDSLSWPVGLVLGDNRRNSL